MNRWKKFVQEYLSFTRNERRGIAILCILILLCWCAPSIVSYFHADHLTDFSSFKKEVAYFKQQQDSLKQAKTTTTFSQNILTANDLPDPFPFDPNTLPESGWEKLGVPLNVIHIIVHYRQAGGHFYKKEDLKKIYGLSADMFQHLEPYIHIEEKKHKSIRKHEYTADSLQHYPKTKARFVKDKKQISLDINLADSATWTLLKGIGPVLSSRIIRFRKALGGFDSIHQIAEVYGLPDSTFQAIKQQLKISPFNLKKLNINTATVNELKSHPYISYRLAASIKAFRDQHGPFKSVDDLKQLQLVDDKIYRKLVPYLIVK